MVRILFSNSIDNYENDFALFQVQAERYLSEKGMAHEIISCTGTEQFFEIHYDKRVDIAIINLLSDSRDGLELSKRLFSEDKTCIIGFLADSPDLALDGYGVNAVGYFLKPFTQHVVSELLDKCMLRYFENIDKSVLLKTNNLHKKIQLSKIIYLESWNKSVNVVCTDENLIVNGKMDDLLDVLPTVFVRTHKSFAINLQYVTSIKRDSAVIRNGENIPISRKFSKSTYEQFVKYVEFGKIN